MSYLFNLVAALLSLVGLAAVALAFMLASPLKRPPPLASIHEGAMKIDAVGSPELSRFQARDGTWLAYRLYAATNGARDRIAILAHGSSAQSVEMNTIAAALAAAGVTAVAMDVRGHGASGTRGDIAYLGQLDDDLADLLGELKKANPVERFLLIGHSSGGGFALRVAGEPLGEAFDKFVLLAPYLGYRAPTNRPAEGPGLWASPDIPRIVATLALGRFGMDWPQALPAIAFANAPVAKMDVTPVYTYRLLQNYTAPEDWKGAFGKAKGRVAVIAGAEDELMDALAYQRELPPLGVPVTILPGVDHMGVVWRPEAIKAIVAALNG
ncbi:alpha/beta fold hydrolase [Roseiarcus sp.]|uniref:alpha/beta fold hydrolase n=1 Tax=Roseiarcus sp. TaxID=1969460 RepID=UPI003F9E3F05